MKRFVFVVVIFAVMNVCFPTDVFTADERPTVIRSISYSKDSKTTETITFKLSAPVTPKIFTLDGGNPRLVLDFPQCIYWGKTSLTPADSNLASAIRIALHRTPAMMTRVAVDLSKQTQVYYASRYSEQGRSFIVTLAPSGSPMPTKVVPERYPPLPVVSSPREAVKEPAAKSVTAPVQTLLDISFDGSSPKGEMVLVHVNDFQPPTVSAIEKNTPRILCDFKAAKLGSGVRETILTKGKYVERIRTARQKDGRKVQVIVDLTPGRDYDLQQFFYKNDKLFVLIVNELKPDAHNE